MSTDFSEHETRVCAYVMELGTKAAAKYDESRRLGLSPEASRMFAVLWVARAESVEKKWVEHALDELLKERSNKEVHI